jgi:hypothetical protein
MELNIKILVWDRHIYVVGLNPSMEYRPLLLINGVSNGNRDI